MISASKPITSSAQCLYYLNMTGVKYYANLHEQAGYWAGDGARRLGLTGPIGEKELQHLFDGLSPDGKSKLVQNAGKANRQRAYDFSPSPPKCVSVYWAMSEPEQQAKVENLHEEAVQAVVDFYQEKAAYTRRGKGGTRLEKADLVIACFQHANSRAMDPQLHTHLLIFNIGLRADGTSGSLYNHEFYELRKQADLIYLTHLALGLALELGLKLEAKEHGFEIAGVPKELCEFFSKRRAAIKEFMQEHGLEGAIAASHAAMETRPAKEHRARHELFAEWQAIGQAMGWGPEQARLPQPGKVGSRIDEEVCRTPERGNGGQTFREAQRPLPSARGKVSSNRSPEGRS